MKEPLDAPSVELLTDDALVPLVSRAKCAAAWLLFLSLLCPTRLDTIVGISAASALLCCSHGTRGAVKKARCVRYLSVTTVVLAAMALVSLLAVSMYAGPQLKSKMDLECHRIDEAKPPPAVHRLAIVFGHMEKIQKGEAPEQLETLVNSPQAELLKPHIVVGRKLAAAVAARLTPAGDNNIAKCEQAVKVLRKTVAMVMAMGTLYEMLLLLAAARLARTTLALLRVAAVTSTTPL